MNYKTMQSTPALSAIVAMDKNRLIGQNNALPWHLPADLKHFKSLTLGKPIVMGRKTWDSIGKPLPGRENIVITRDASLSLDGAHVVNSIDAAIEKACQLYAPLEEIMFIGGMMLYQEMLPRLNRLYITEIDHEFAGDAWFPELQTEDWQELSRQTFNEQTQGFHYHFVELSRHQHGVINHGDN